MKTTKSMVFQSDAYTRIVELIGRVPGKNAEWGLNRYINELKAWNQRVNLVSQKSAENIWEEHIVPSLAYAFFMESNQKYLDIGTGAGLPGLVLKIVFPDLNIDLLDSNRKKILFCKYMVNEIGIKQTEVILERAENLKPKYDGALFRAVSGLDHLHKVASAAIKTGGHFLTLKGASENFQGTSVKYRQVKIPEKLKNESFRLAESNMIIAQI